MDGSTLPQLDHALLEAAAGPSSYARGVQYLRQAAVGRMWWDEAKSALCGKVRGSTGGFYTTVAYFSGDGTGPRQFEEGQCSCPVGLDCKHVVALVLAADRAFAAAGAQPGRRTAQPGGQPPGWEEPLRSLLAPGTLASGDGRPPVPLAIELTLASAAAGRPGAGRPGSGGQPAGLPPLKLTARLVQPGRSGAWVGGTLSWSRLDSLLYQGGYVTAQVRLLQEIYATYRARGGQAYYSYGEDKHLDLAAFESRQLWPLLAEAAALGLGLLRGRKAGPLEPCGQAELCLDVTRREPGGGLTITPVIRHVRAGPGGPDGQGTAGQGPPGLGTAGQGPAGQDFTGEPAGPGSAGDEAVPLLFLGTAGHGLVWADRAEVRRGGDPGGWRFRLARLTPGVPPQLQQLALTGQRLEIPAADQDRFAADYCPLLRRAVSVISSDGSFTPPEVAGPVLVLRVSFSPDHRASVSWEWSYRVGEARFRLPVQPGPGSPGYRDPAAERRIAASLETLLGPYGLLRRERAGAEAGQARLQAASFRGMDTMRLATELLPLLADQPAVTVEVTGEPAGYREASDTLLIGVSAADAGDTDWFDLGVTITVEGQQVPFTDVFVALSEGQTHLLLPGGAYFSLQKPELQALAKLIGEARALRDTPGGTLKISRFQASLWAELAELGVVTHQAQAWQEQAGGLLTAGTLQPAAPPAGLSAQLRPYQLAGFSWLAFLWRHQLGGILADDMGLGKTLQSLALICHARESRRGRPPFLIVAPTSVVPNWAAEAERFAPGLRVTAVTGTAARRRESVAETVAGADVVVTSYTLLRIDFDGYAALKWSGLFLDEAQAVKNHQSKAYQCARRLPAPVKFAITGTPLENNLMELWSLLSITAPGLFPDPERFREYYARPIERGGEAELLAQLRRRIKPLIKRRTKEQVAADLPPRQEQVLQVELHPRHRKVYETHLQRERQKVLGLIGDFDANRLLILRSLTLLRQLSLHAGLVDETHRELPSSKIDTLLEQLRDVAGGGHRALVFSQFTRFLGQVRERLDGAGVEYCYLDGKTRDRAAVLRRFKEGSAPVFLISLKAGGFGLNLAEADYCFVLDPWWNPAAEAQAVDRAHRIGQTRTVMVYRLISAGTIEEKVMALKARKAELFASVIDEGNVFGGGLSADDIRALLG